MVMRGVCRQIVLVDRNMERARAEADDIRHAVPFAKPAEVTAGGYTELDGSRVVVICAGVGQKPGETRLQLLKRNAAVFREVVPRCLRARARRGAGGGDESRRCDDPSGRTLRGRVRSPAGRVIGSGTTLDTARFRSLLGIHCGVDSHHVHAYVIGEHGDSEVLTWSLVTIGGMPLEALLPAARDRTCQSIRDDIDQKVRGAASRSFAAKGRRTTGSECARSDHPSRAPR